MPDIERFYSDLISTRVLTLIFRIMKKILFTLAVIFSVMTGTRVDAQSDFGIGVKAGINISDQFTSGSGEFVNINGLMRFNGGAYFNYFFLDKLAVQPELLISGKGSDWDDPLVDVADLLTYIDLPVLLRYQVIDMLNIHAGPQAGLLISAKQKDNDSGETVNINDYYKKPDLGLVVGIEANLPARINLTVRYVTGLISVTTEDEYIDPWKNNFFQFSVGYRFVGR